MSQAETDAVKLFPNYPDAQDRYIQGVQRGLDRAISQQSQQYEIDTHVVQQALASDHAPISEQQLIGLSPQVAASWRSMQLNNSYAALNVEHMFDANARGIAKTYGTEIAPYLQRVLAPSGDQNRITDASQLWSNIDATAGEKSPLTNTGVSMLNDLLALRGSPQGEAISSQLSSFLKTYHNQQTGTTGYPGLTNEAGEDRFNKSMLSILPAITTGLKNGKTVAQMTDPKSPDYVGNFGVKMPDQVHMSQEIIDATENAPAAQPKATLNPATSTLLDKQVKSGAFTQAQAEQLKPLLMDLQAKKITPAQFKTRATALGVLPPPVPLPGG